ncbi:unnamed protein product [Caenorhabditis sp. 36 PRJEB53466]|nr:unnamed protein product [Caenorhabditis sp. 36 PRJEB53466]
MDNSDSLSVNIHGLVKIAEFPQETNLCVKLHTVSSGDWKISNGDTALLSSFCYRGDHKKIHIDLPFEYTFKGTSPFMWPRLVLNCFSKDVSGKDGVIGYGAISIPTEPGKHCCRVYCFLPETSSTIQLIISKLRRVNSEFIDPLLTASSDGRNACCTTTTGYVDVDLNVSVKHSDTGYQFSSGFADKNSNNTISPSIIELAGINKNFEIREKSLEHTSSEEDSEEINST